MDFKQWRKENPAIMAGGAIVLFLIAMGIAYRSMTGDDSAAIGPPGAKLYYYDLNKKELFVAVDVAPPIATASGPHEGQPAGVRAYVYSCTDCKDIQSRFVGYLETLDPEFRAKVDDTQAQGWFLGAIPVNIEGLDEAALVRTEKDPNWVAKVTSDGEKIIDSVGLRCGSGQTLIECLP